jgi:glycosyltransferase involved in cell wall biosynthesis
MLIGQEKVQVSVIVPCRNPGPYFNDLLESLAEQSFDQRWELVIVDNGSRRETRSLANDFANRLNIKYVQASKKANASYARNVGVRAASSDKLLFIDADDQVDSDYIRALAESLKYFDFVTSRVDSRKLNPEWAFEAQGPWQETGVEVSFDFLPATGINIGISRPLFESLGGFPEEYSGSQDIAFSWLAQLAKGTKIQFGPEALYLYRHRQNLYGIYRQSSNWGRSHALLYRQFRSYGMPGKSIKMALTEWKDVFRLILRARTKKELSPLIVRLGYCVGRLMGSIRYRILYL